MGTNCVPSERLTAQPNCECDSLRSRLEAAQQQYSDLLQEHSQLKTQYFETLQHRELQISESSNQTVLDTTPHPNLLDVSPDHRFSDRILCPTFSHRPNINDMNWSTLSSAWELWGDDTGVHSTSESQVDSLAEVDQSTYLVLVDAFFDRRWPYLPVLHRPSFVDHHLTPFLANSVTNPASKFLVNIVCAIAAMEKAWVQRGNVQSYKQFFNRAVKDLHFIMDIGDFECVQCLLLLCMYGHNEPQSINMWYTSGMALHLAIGLDLHRKECLSSQNLLCAEMSKRVFWCAYVMNCSIAINMGRPLGIHEFDITTPFPLQLSDEQLTESFEVPDMSGIIIPLVTDTSTFIHIIKLRQINAAVYELFHSIRCGSMDPDAMDPDKLERTRSSYFLSLNEWLITAPRYIRTLSTFQSTEWFQIAFHHAVLSLYRPSRAAPMPSSDDLRVCTESAIGLITSYSSLYARNRIKYTFVAIHSIFIAAVTMLYALRASPSLRQDLTKPVVQTNILTFLTLFRGISNGRAIGEKCSKIIERLGNSLLTLFNDAPMPDADADVDTEFQLWFGLRTHTFATPARYDELSGEDQGISSNFPDIRVDMPWEDLFVGGIDMGFVDI